MEEIGLRISKGHGLWHVTTKTFLDNLYKNKIGNFKSRVFFRDFVGKGQERSRSGEGSGF